MKRFPHLVTSGPTPLNLQFGISPSFHLCDQLEVAGKAGAVDLNKHQELIRLPPFFKSHRVSSPTPGAWRVQQHPRPPPAFQRIGPAPTGDIHSISRVVGPAQLAPPSILKRRRIQNNFFYWHVLVPACYIKHSFNRETSRPKNPAGLQAAGANGPDGALGGGFFWLLYCSAAWARHAFSSATYTLHISMRRHHLHRNQDSADFLPFKFHPASPIVLAGSGEEPLRRLSPCKWPST